MNTLISCYKADNNLNEKYLSRLLKRKNIKPF